MKLKRASVIVKIVILALVVYAGITLFSLKRQTEAAQAKLDELQQQVDDALQTNEGLQHNLDHSDDPEIREDVARGDFGLVDPGEIIFYDVGD